MKQLKKLTGLFMCIVLAAGCLTGCGGKSDATILTSSVKKITSAKNFDMSMKMSGKITASEEEESESMDIDTEIKATQFADPLKTKFTLKTKLLGQSKSMTYEGYIQKEGDKYVCYVKSGDEFGDEWTRLDMDGEDAAVMSKIDSMKKQLTEDVSKYTQKEDIEENGKKYLTYEYTITADSVKNGLDSLMASYIESETEDERKESEEMIGEWAKVIGDIKMTILIDRETETIYQIRCPAADMVKRMMDFVANSIYGYLASKDGKDEQEKAVDIKFEVSGMDLIITYTNIGSAAEFEVPEEALKAEDLSKAINDEIDDECEE